MSIPVKVCTKCGIEKPATFDHFYREARGKYGLFAHCKLCHSAARQGINHLKADLKKRNEQAQKYYDAVAFGKTFRTCSRCKAKKAATAENFYFDSTKGTLYSCCKPCHHFYTSLTSAPKADFKRRTAAANLYYEAVAFGCAFKVCGTCKLKKPARLEFFSRYPKLKYGLNSVCKTCKNVQSLSKNKAKADLRKRTGSARAYYDAVSFGAAFKVCSACKKKLPATRVYFYGAIHNKYGLTSVCVTCSLKRSKVYAENHPERVNAYKKKWEAENPETCAVQRRNRRARKLEAPGSHTAVDIASQLQAQKGKCWWCGCKLKKSGLQKFHVDHRIALSKGGSNGPENLVCSCPKCNRKKSAKSPLEFAGRLF